MKRVTQFTLWSLMLIAAAGLVLAGCATMESGGSGCSPKIDKQIAKEAQLTAFKCYVKKYKGEDSLHFDVALKNVSPEDQRYRVNIFLDNGKAVGGLIPRKTKKGLVKPGATAKFTYPIKGLAESPKEVTLIIKTLSK